MESIKSLVCHNRKKAIFVDLDDTLWGGTIAEDDAKWALEALINSEGELFEIEKNSLSLDKMADCSDELVPGEFTDSRKGWYEPEPRGWKASLRLKTLVPNAAKKVRVIARFRRALHT